jgi:SDR family mycofactocin-dependent oxidoreductase
MNTEALSRRGFLGTGIAAAATVAGMPLIAGSSAAAEAEQAQPAGTGAGRLKGKVALITGGARGIGRATAVALAREGADISFCDIAEQLPTATYPMGTPEKMAETRVLVEKEGRQCLVVKADVRDMKQMRAFIDQTLKKFGKLDICIANAGTVVWKLLSEQTDEDWDTVIDTNVTGVANTLRAVMPHMKERKQGRIVTLSSVGGEMGVPTVPAYIASKWAVIGLTKSVALEMGPYNVTANAIGPTAVNTPMFMSRSQWQTMVPAGEQATEEKISAIMKSVHALPVHWIEPEDVADGIVFLCTDEAKYISGITLDIQAGGNARNAT